MRPPLRSLRSLLSLALLLAMAFAAHAQALKVEGTVRDAQSGEPLVAAQVHVQGRNAGTLTDSSGHYVLRVEGQARVLEVTHVGYQKATLQLQQEPWQRLDVALTPTSLPSVLITAGPQPVLADKTIHLYDYEFMDGQLMMIIYDRAARRSMLALVDARDSIVETEPGIEEPGKLVRDCLGNVHAISRHNACQLFLNEGEISMYVDSLAVFERTVQPCLGNIGANYYFDYHRFNNQILDYLTFDVESGEWNPFLQIKNKEKMHQLMDPLGPYIGIASSEAGMMSLSEEDWKKVGKIDAEFQFQQMAFFYPVDAPLRVIDGQVMVFDHLNGIIRKFRADGEAVAEVPIDYHKLPHWERAIIVDDVRGEAYTLYMQHGYASLRKIDLATGTVGEAIEIPRQFPNKVMVRDGIAYFMYKQGIYDETNRLYRMPL